MMRPIIVDKIASVAQCCGLAHELRLASAIPCEEGVVLAVEILTDKSTYNTLELTSGRMAKVARGDIIVGALGHRRALFGYSGHIPSQLAVGDVIQVLNIGGVLGVCDSANPEKGRPFDSASASAYRRASAAVRSTRTPRSRPMRCRSWRSPAPAWRPARPPLPAR
jgi:hypothetical protein